MEIKGLGLQEQMRMMRGVESIIPKRTEEPAITGVNEPKRHSFSDFLSEQVSQVNQDGLEAEQAIERSVTGSDANPHETMIAIQKADVSFSLLMSVKERLERAYQELIRTPI